ncbi:MAG: hypothetical protein FJX46_17620, partial [Alphaproteobacteria bacterium]|nr:hypothetical protein [Alphaproteobacteria bacterium]
MRAWLALCGLLLAGCASPQAPAPMSLDEARRVALRIETSGAANQDASNRQVAPIGLAQVSDAARRQAEAEPPADAGAAALAGFLRQRGNARLLLGRSQEALADLKRAREHALESRRSAFGYSDLRMAQLLYDLYLAQWLNGPLDQAIVWIEECLSYVSREDWNNTIGWGVDLVTRLADVGDADGAARALVPIERALQIGESRAARGALAAASMDELNLRRGHAAIARRAAASARGDYDGAIAHGRQALAHFAARQVSPHDRRYYEHTSTLAMVMARAGRLAEAEAEARAALAGLQGLRDVVARAIPESAQRLTRIVQAQGRLGEAEALGRETVALWERIQIRDRGLYTLADVIAAQERWAEAIAFYRRNPSTPRSARDQRAVAISAQDMVLALAMGGAGDEAVGQGRAMHRALAEAMGADHPRAREAEALLGLALLKAGERAAGQAAIEAALPRLLAQGAAREGEADTRSDQDRRLEIVLD